MAGGVAALLQKAWSYFSAISPGCPGDYDWSLDVCQILISCLMRHLLKSFAHPPIELISYYWPRRVFYLFWKQVICQILQILYPSMWLSFCSLKNVIHTTKVLNFSVVPFNSFIILRALFWMSCIRIYPLPLSHKDFLLFSSKGFILLYFKFRSMIHFEEVVVYGVRCRSRFICFPVDVHFLQDCPWRLLSTLNWFCNLVKIQKAVSVWFYF